MRLVGYIKEQRKNYFAKPVYSSNGVDFFYHELDKSHVIQKFSETQKDLTTLKRVYLSKDFVIGSKAAMVFVGFKGYLKYDLSENAIGEIINYINDNPSSIESFNELLNQALNLKKVIFSERIKNNQLKAENKIFENDFILNFDFPSPNTKIETKVIPILDDESDEIIQTKIIKLQAAEKKFESTLRQRSETRRNKLKSYNYQFTHNRKNN